MTFVTFQPIFYNIKRGPRVFVHGLFMFDIHRFTRSPPLLHETSNLGRAVLPDVRTPRCWMVGWWFPNALLD